MAGVGRDVDMDGWGGGEGRVVEVEGERGEGHAVVGEGSIGERHAWQPTRSLRASRWGGLWSPKWRPCRLFGMSAMLGTWSAASQLAWVRVGGWRGRGLARRCCQRGTMQR
jgi:hypothetical protein